MPVVGTLMIYCCANLTAVRLVGRVPLAGLRIDEICGCCTQSEVPPASNWVEPAAVTIKIVVLLLLSKIMHNEPLPHQVLAHTTGTL